MLNILLIWLLSFTGTPDQSTSLNCAEYNFSVIDSDLRRKKKICYVSTLTKHQRKHILTIRTDSIAVQFAVLRTFYLSPSQDGGFKGTRTYAVILGEPDQLYLIQEMIKERGDKSYYYFSLRPVQQNGSIHRNIRGRVLEVSNQPICNLIKSE